MILQFMLIHTNLDNVIGGVNSKIARFVRFTESRNFISKERFIKKTRSLCSERKCEELKESLFNVGRKNW